MPKLIKFVGGKADFANDAFVEVVEDAVIPDGPGGVILPLARFQSEGAALLDQGRSVGVRLNSDDQVEALAYDLPRLALVALDFPKYRDGRAYSSAALLRERYGFKGEVRAVGDVLREQARYMVRCGFDAFEFADGTTPAELEHVVRRFRHVYQAAADDLVPVFVERSKAAAHG